jgi:integrase
VSRAECRPRYSEGGTNNAYRRAISRAAKLAGVEAWHPHQLRHRAATNIRKEFGLEAAQHVLGHHSTRMAEIYAERDANAARQIAAKIG